MVRVTLVSMKMYDVIRGVLKVILEDVFPDAVYYTEHDNYPKKKLYLSHSGKWMQNGYSLCHSSTFT
jgi:hypothetical protein